MVTEGRNRGWTQWRRYLLAVVGVAALASCGSPSSRPIAAPSSSSPRCELATLSTAVMDGEARFTLSPPGSIQAAISASDACAVAWNHAVGASPESTALIEFGLLDWPPGAVTAGPTYRVVFSGGVCVRPNYFPPQDASASPSSFPTCAPNQRIAVLVDANDGTVLTRYADEVLEAEVLPSPSS